MPPEPRNGDPSDRRTPGRQIGRAFVVRADEAGRRRVRARRREARRLEARRRTEKRPGEKRGRRSPAHPDPPARADGPAPDAAASFSAAAVVAAVLTVPWFFGSAASLQLALASAGLAVVAGGLALRFGSGPVPAAVWPAAGALALGAAQAVSPISGDSLETAAGTLTPHLVPVSVARSSTRETLAVLTLAVLAFLLAARAGSAAAGRRVVWWGVAGTAAAFALVGLIGRSGLTTEYGLSSTDEHAGALTGPFFAGLNRSHAAELLNLGLAAALGLLAVGGGRAAAVCGVVVAAGLAVTGSRAGLLAVPAGLLLAGVAVAATRRRRATAALEPPGRSVAAPFDRGRAGWVVAAGALTVAAGIAVSLWRFEVEETTLGRLEGSRQSTFREQIAGRWDHWGDAVGVAADLPLFGAGLGTHRYATPGYQTEPSSVWYTHADNQYVETLVEGGAAGAALLAAFAVCLFLGVRGAGRAGAADAVVAAAYAGGAIAAHALFDYGIARPPVLLTAAVLLGTACGAGTPGTPGRFARVPRAALAAVLVVAAGWAAREHWRAAPAAPHRELNTVNDDATVWPEAAVVAEIERLGAAVERRPDDVEGRFALGRLLMRRYRDETFAALREDPAAAGASDRTLARIADPGFGAFAALGPGGAAGLSAVRSDERVRGTLVPAFAHLSAARAACPFVPRLDYHLARIAWAVPGEDPTGRPSLLALHRNFPADVDAQAAAAARAQRLGLDDLADACWRAAFALDPGRADRFVAAATRDRVPTDAELARILALLPADPVRRSAAAAAVSGEFPALAAAIAAEVLAGDPAPRERAFALRLAGDAAGAVEALRTHLAAASRDHEARAALIGWLIEDGLLDDAAEQLGILTALSPADPAARRLADRLAEARRERARGGNGRGAPRPGGTSPFRNGPAPDVRAGEPNRRGPRERRIAGRGAGSVLMGADRRP